MGFIFIKSIYCALSKIFSKIVTTEFETQGGPGLATLLKLDSNAGVSLFI